MDSRTSVSYKFLKVLSRADNVMNEMSLPRKFLREYGDRLPLEFNLKLRNGYHVPVNYNKKKGTIKGLYVFLGQFRLTGGEILVFEYYGKFDLNLYVIGKDCSEINYLDFLHPFQSGHALRVSARSGGWRFVQFTNNLEPIMNEIEPPLSFLVNCGGVIRSPFMFVLSNGYRFKGNFNPSSNKLFGLEQLCEELELENLNVFHMMLLTYDGHSMIEISLFDEFLSEIVFPQSGTPYLEDNVEEAEASTGTGSGVCNHKFEITVQPFHMLDYCYGVNIPACFKNLWFLWRDTQCLNVHFGNRTWKLEIKPRHDWKRVSLNEGWTKFRYEMGLQVGDICLFECMHDSNKFDNFKVKVTRKNT